MCSTYTWIWKQLNIRVFREFILRSGSVPTLVFKELPKKCFNEYIFHLLVHVWPVNLPFSIFFLFLFFPTLVKRAKCNSKNQSLQVAGQCVWEGEGMTTLSGQCVKGVGPGYTWMHDHYQTGCFGSHLLCCKFCASLSQLDWSLHCDQRAGAECIYHLYTWKVYVCHLACIFFQMYKNPQAGRIVLHIFQTLHSLTYTQSI